MTDRLKKLMDKNGIKKLKDESATNAELEDALIEIAENQSDLEDAICELAEMLGGM